MRIWYSPLILVLAAMTPSLQAQLIWNLEDHEQVSRVSLSGKFGIDVSATMDGIGFFPGQRNPLDQEYDDGFVVPNATEPITENWSYLNDSQVINAAELEMNVSLALPTAAELDGAGTYGFELTYGRLVGRRGRFSWGYEVALGYGRLSMENSSELSGPVLRLTDVYEHAGNLPPAPFTSLETDPNPVPILDTPIDSFQTVIPGASRITGSRELESSMYSLRFGPFVEIAAFPRASVGVGAGFVGVLHNTEFSYSESVTITGRGANLIDGLTTQVNRSGVGSSTDFSLGFYMSSRVSYALTRRWDLFGQFEYQMVGDISQSAGPATANVDLGGTMYLSAGIAYYF